MYRCFNLQFVFPIGTFILFAKHLMLFSNLSLYPLPHMLCKQFFGDVCECFLVIQFQCPSILKEFRPTSDVHPCNFPCSTNIFYLSSKLNSKFIHRRCIISHFHDIYPKLYWILVVVKSFSYFFHHYFKLLYLSAFWDQVHESYPFIKLYVKLYYQ